MSRVSVKHMAENAGISKAFASQVAHCNSDLGRSVVLQHKLYVDSGAAYGKIRGHNGKFRSHIRLSQCPSGTMGAFGR